MAKESKFTVNDNDRLIVSALKGSEPLTVAEINEKLGSSLLPIHFIHASNGGFIAKAGTREVTKYRKSPQTVYYFISAEHMGTNVKGEPANYSENQDAILAAAAKFDGDFLKSDLEEVLGMSIAPGTVTPLVNRGNLGKREDKRIVMKPYADEVATWEYVKDAE